MLRPVKHHVFTSHLFSSCETFFTSPSHAEQLELMAYSKYKQQMILYYYFKNNKAPTIKRLLRRNN